MDLRTNAPLIGIASVVLTAIGAIADNLFSERIKAPVVDRLSRLTDLAERPRTRAFYGFMVLASSTLTILIMSMSGALESFRVGRESLLLAVKSTSPLLFALF